MKKPWRKTYWAGAASGLMVGLILAFFYHSSVCGLVNIALCYGMLHYFHRARMRKEEIDILIWRMKDEGIHVEGFGE
jgi:hypothetical protein